jgi:spore maturation protein CgeB
MKVLLVGSNKKWAIEKYYAKYLRQLGVDINHFTSADMVSDWRGKSILNKILFKTGIMRGYERINKELISLAYDYKPDIILIFKGMEIFPGSLETLRKDFRLTNYNPDHPYIISSAGSGNSNVTNSVSLYHLHFCYHSGLQTQIQQQYNIPTAFLPFGYELSNHDYNLAANEQELNKVCFVGNPDKTRVETIQAIAESEVPVDVFGHGWQNTALKNLDNVKIHDAVYDEELWKTLRRYRVQVNIFRKHNIGSHNMRTFEIPAVGGIQLSPRSEEQMQFFKEGEDVFFYNDKSELIESIKMILSLTEEQALNVRSNARQRSVNAGYSYKDRAFTVYNTFKSML